MHMEMEWNGITSHVTQKGNLTKTHIFWFTTLCLQLTTASSNAAVTLQRLTPAFARRVEHAAKLILIFFHVFFFKVR